MNKAVNATKRSKGSKLPEPEVKIKNVEKFTIFPEEEGQIKVVLTNRDSNNFRSPLDTNLDASTDSLFNLPINEGNLASKDELLGSLNYSKINLAPSQYEKFTVGFADPEIRTPSAVELGASHTIAEVAPNNTTAQRNKSNNQVIEFFSTEGSDAVIDWNALALNTTINTPEHSKEPKQGKSPDLKIKIRNVETPTIFPEEAGKIKLVVTNQGNKIFKGPLDINLYASTDSLLDLPLNQGNLAGKDELLGSLNYSKINLAPGQSETFTVQFADPEIRTPSVVAPGAYYLIAEVDPNNTITEGNESNNQAIKFFSTDGSDAVIDWNALALNIIQNTATPTLIASRNLAIVHTAIYDATNAIYQTHKPYFVNINPSEIRYASPEAAVVEAAYETLLNLYPTQKVVLDEQRFRSLVEIPNGTAKDAGIELGKRVADQIIALRSNDGSDKANEPPYSLEPTVGVWQPTPPNFASAAFPNWGLVTPFAIQSGSTFRPDGFPDLNSAEYAQEFDEVRILGEKNSTIRTPEQTEIAQFWSFGRPDTFTTPGQWNRIAETVALQQSNTLEENARLFALLNIGIADAGIAAYDAKYAFNRWRPITAIREADIDGNANTNADLDWEPLLNTPSHPDYLAAHSVFGGAAGKILADFFGNNISFTTTSQELPGISRSYMGFIQAAEESSNSRIYGGVHFRSAAQDGLTTGIAVGEFVSQHFLV